MTPVIRESVSVTRPLPTQDVTAAMAAPMVSEVPIKRETKTTLLGISDW